MRCLRSRWTAAALTGALVLGSGAAQAQFTSRRSTPAPGATVSPTPPATSPPTASGSRGAAPPPAAESGRSAAREAAPARRPLTEEESRYPRLPTVTSDIQEGAARGGSLEGVPAAEAALQSAATACFDAARGTVAGLEVDITVSVTLRQGGSVESASPGAEVVRERHGYELVEPSGIARSSASSLVECVMGAFATLPLRSTVRTMYTATVALGSREMSPAERGLADARGCLLAEDWECLEAGLRAASRERALRDDVASVRVSASMSLGSALAETFGSVDDGGLVAEVQLEILEAARGLAESFWSIVGEEPSPSRSEVRRRLASVREEIERAEREAAREERAAAREAAREEREAERERRGSSRGGGGGGGGYPDIDGMRRCCERSTGSPTCWDSPVLASQHGCHY